MQALTPLQQDIQITEALMAAGQTDEAMAQFEKYRQVMLTPHVYDLLLRLPYPEKSAGEMIMYLEIMRFFYPENTSALTRLGQLYRRCAQNDKAREVMLDILKYDTSNCHALGVLAELDFNSKRPEFSIWLRKLAEATDNPYYAVIADTHDDEHAGNFEKAWKTAMTALETWPGNTTLIARAITNAYDHFGSDVERCAPHVEAILATQTVSLPTDFYKIYKIRHVLLAGDRATAAAILDAEIDPVQNPFGIAPAIFDFSAYTTILKTAVDNACPDLAEAPLSAVIIGDSHALGYHAGRVQAASITTRLIEGIKLWHLSPASHSIRRQRLARAVADLQDQSVILSLGEIDTRPDEGIFPHARKTGKDSQGVIAETITGYIQFLKEHGITDRAGQTFHLGRPAPNRAHVARVLPMEDHAPYLDMVRVFNTALREACTQNGIGYLDLYSFQVGDDGYAKDEDDFIDDLHLHPSVLGRYLDAHPAFGAFFSAGDEHGLHAA